QLRPGHEFKICRCFSTVPGNRGEMRCDSRLDAPASHSLLTKVVRCSSVHLRPAPRRTSFQRFRPHSDVLDLSVSRVPSASCRSCLTARLEWMCTTFHKGASTIHTSSAISSL